MHNSQITLLCECSRLNISLSIECEIVPVHVRLVLFVGTGNCTGGHVPVCKPRLSWDHGVGAYAYMSVNSLFTSFMVSEGDKCYFCSVG